MLFNLISIFHVANSPLGHDVFFFFEVWICLEFVHLSTWLLVCSFLYLQNQTMSDFGIRVMLVAIIPLLPPFHQK